MRKSPKRQKLVESQSWRTNWCSRGGGMNGESYAQYGKESAIRKCVIGSYFVVKGDVDWNNAVACSMHVAQGDNTPMVKLIFQKAVQQSFCQSSKTVNWEVAPYKAVDMAVEIFGGIWNAGCSPYIHACSQANELYVCFVEEHSVWLQRSTGGRYAKINEDGFIEMMG
jgi:hypothetical protein